jgi:hypothetical protein
MHICTYLAGGRDCLPLILWQGKDVLRYEGLAIDLADIRRLVEKELEEAEEILNNEVMKGLFTSEMLAEHTCIVDNLRNQHAGYNFIEDDNNLFSLSRHNLAKAILEHPYHGPILADLKDNGDIAYNKQAVEDWFQSVNDFLEKLYVVMHISSGLPQRGAEAAETLIVNTMTAQRNLYSILDEVCIVGRYNKTSHNTGLDKVIPRAVHPKPAALLVKYLTLVRPLERSFAQQIAAGKGASPHNFDTNLWVGIKGKWNATKMSSILQETFYQYTHVPIGLAAWRHIAESLMRHKLTSQMGCQDEIREWILEAAADEQAGHTNKIAQHMYAAELGGLEQGLHEKECKRYLLVSGTSSFRMELKASMSGQWVMAHHHWAGPTWTTTSRSHFDGHRGEG